MDSEHVVGDSDRGSRKRQRNTTSKERKKEIRQDPIFSVSQKKVQTIARQMKTGTGISEKREGDTKSRNYVDKKKVRKLGTEWKIYNIKDALRSMNKIRGISEAKRIVIIKRPEKKTVVVKTEIFYQNDDLRQKFVSLLKKGKKLDNIKFPEVNLIHEIKHKKL
ncbi:hypothetical protein ILUMI_14815, partial [Ignelater luminosus]